MGQHSQDRKKRPGWPEHDSTDWAAGTRQPWEDSKDRRVGEGQLGQDILGRIAWTGQPGQDSNDRLARTRTGWPRQNEQDRERTAKKELG